MIAGLSIEAFVTLHVVVSLVAIATGLVAMGALARGHWLGGWQLAFLVTTAATSITGFLFPFSGITPAVVVGAVSLAVLAVAFGAFAVRRRAGPARTVYAISGVAALYLNLFVLVAQLFLKVPALQALAPTQAEPPFLIAQLAVLAASIALCVAATRAARRAVPQPA
ncbi:hypothetical protein ACI7BZ_09010 [Xanthobacter sp. AM11]|uniref:hypothetical protein n=1 Tax=Xanthobacter sp. AM11 TaxID=3380643 RepID=UPI0039BF744D